MTMNTQASRSTARAAIMAALVCFLLTALRAGPPAPRQPNDNGSFSAVSAQKVLEDLYSSGVTHHIGTENNRALKEQILDRLRDLGYSPTVQSTMACWDGDGCGHVENILARLEGKSAGKAVLLAVHYDSVGAGPSVSDDGVAVAVALEIARILKSEPQLENDVIFLIDDGEEANLLGASAFAAEHPWAKEVGAVVNLEARGTSGQSYMFETGTNNAWLIDVMKNSIPRPTTSSVFYSIYQRLPNDTDFTVFKFHGMNGVNFAFIKNVVHYHTPLDDLAHASPATMQHQGDNALGMVRGLANTSLEDPPRGTASWFDLWGFGIISWPETWNLPLSLFSLLLIVSAFGLQAKQGKLSGSQIWRGIATFPAALIDATFLALLASWILKTLGQSPDWPAATWAPKALFWLIGISAGALVITVLGRKAGGLAIWLGALLSLAALATLTSAFVPGAAYLFLAPALVGGALALANAVWQVSWLGALAAFLTISVASAAQLILAWSLWEAMGVSIMAVVTFLVAGLTVLVLAPATDTLVSAGRRVPLYGLAVAGAFLAISLVLPAYSDESPRALSFFFVQDADTGAARLAVRPGRTALPSSLEEAVDWNDSMEFIYPWHEGDPQYLAADVETTPVPPPTIEILEQVDSDSGRRIRARLQSPRRAARAALVFQQPNRIESLFLEGWNSDLQADETWLLYTDGTRVIRFATMPEEGIEFVLEVEGFEAFPVQIIDYSFGLPPAADALTRARPSNMVPIGQGDLTIVHTRGDL